MNSNTPAPPRATTITSRPTHAEVSRRAVLALLAGAVLAPLAPAAAAPVLNADLSEPFEVTVPDDSLAPTVPRGCVMRLDPVARRPAREGWPCLVRDTEGRYYLRTYDASAGLVVLAVMRGIDYPCCQAPAKFSATNEV